MKMYQCPSDIQRAQFQVYGPGGVAIPGIFAAPSSYAAFVGGDETEVTVGDSVGQFHGCFYRNSHVRFQQITDGLTRTMFVGERSSRLGGTTWVGAVSGVSRAMARVVGTADHVPNDLRLILNGLPHTKIWSTPITISVMEKRNDA